MSSLLGDVASAEIAAKIPWPSDVILYQPVEGFREVDNLSISREELPEVFPVVGQILLPELASCLSVKTYLYMLGVEFSVRYQTNTEFMSPSGSVPFIKVGPLILAEMDTIATFLSHKGKSLEGDMSDEQRADMKAYIALVQNVLVKAELYISWCDQDTCEKVSKPRYGSPYAWPLNKIISCQKQWGISSKLRAVGWKGKTTEEVLIAIEDCCRSLAEKLGEQTYFMGDRPSQLDAVVFGHLSSILKSHLPVSKLPQIVQSFPNLADFCRRIDEEFGE